MPRNEILSYTPKCMLRWQFFSGGDRWSTPSETQSQVLYTSPGSYGCNWCDNDRHHQQQSFSGLLSPGQSNHTNTINSVNCHQQQSFSGLLSPGRSNHTNTINSVNCHQQQSFSGLLSPGQSNHTNTINSVNCHQ